MLVMHGATYAALKTGDPMAARAAALGRFAAAAFVVTFVAAGAWVAIGLDGHHIVAGADPLGPANPLHKTVATAKGAWLDNYRAHGLLWLAPLVAIVAALSTGALLGAGRAGAAFVSSSLAQAGTIFTAGIGLFPFLMPSSTHPGHGLTVWTLPAAPRRSSLC